VALLGSGTTQDLLNRIFGRSRPSAGTPTATQAKAFKKKQGKV